MAQLPVDIDASYADRSPADRAHQQHHDTLHSTHNELDAVPDGYLVQKVGGVLAGVSPDVFDGSGAAADAVEAHRVDTTDVHGIADTAALATSASVTSTVNSAVEAHRVDTTDIHGIADTAVLLTPTTFSSHIGSGTGAEVTALDARYLVQARRAAVADAGGTIVAWDDFEGGTTLVGRTAPSGQAWTSVQSGAITGGRLAFTGTKEGHLNLGSPLSGTVTITFGLAGLTAGENNVIFRRTDSQTYLTVQLVGGILRIGKVASGTFTSLASITVPAANFRGPGAYRLHASISGSIIFGELVALTGAQLASVSYTLTDPDATTYATGNFVGFKCYGSAQPAWVDDFLVRSYA